jgi:anti-sigma factor RsiW
VIQQFSDFLDGELDAKLAEDLCRHLELCEDCRVVVDTCRKTVKVFCKSEPLPLPADVQARLDQMLAEKCRKRS